MADSGNGLTKSIWKQESFFYNNEDKENSNENSGDNKNGSK
ncbi:32331_t:CDS:2 [Gigaspora margarita]|uniref:32331_t:CDS:1 n=1 Tax=Gigaspora margarita TaxID=4874 RepID=A0ABN7V7R6_GIGMA|nr:32331_t:CDS:2 [Gigaspora margarita]